jgi:hypothetical protein
MLLLAIATASCSSVYGITASGQHADALAHTGGSSESHHVDIWVARDRLPDDLARAVDDVEDTIGNTSVRGGLREDARRQRRQLGRLEHHRVAGQQGRGQLGHDLLQLYGQTLLDPDQFQTLVIFTAVPGTGSYGKLRLLSVIGSQRL